MPASILLGAGAALLLASIAYAFNRLVRLANLVREAWSGIDVQLERRHDLVPNLVEVVRSYATFERDVLEGVTRLRAESRPDRPTVELQDRENALTGRLKSVLALAEAYPQLMANRSFLALQDQLVEIEDHLQMARRYYNGTVRDYNTAVEQFPSNLVAGAFGFTGRPFFQIETATQRRVPNVEIHA